MSANKFTPWFPPSVTPAHDGIYQVQIRTAIKYARWVDGRWHLALRTIERAMKSRMKSHDCYSSKFVGWRGIANPTKDQS